MAKQISPDLRENIFRGLFDNMLDTFSLRKVIVGESGEPVDLEYVDVNPAFEKLWGLKAADVIGRRITEVFSGIENDDVDWIRVLGEVALTGRPLTMEQHYQGTILQISAYCPEPGLVAAIAYDITANKRYESLMASMPDGFAYCKMIYENGEPQDFVYLAVNDAFAKLTGLKEVVGKRVTEVLPKIKETNPELLQICSRVARTGRPERFEDYFEQLRAWLSISVSSQGDGHFMAIFDNITERKQMEETLIERELRYRMLFENVNDAIILLGIDRDGHPGKFVDVNDIACRRLGYSRDELLGLSVKDISAQSENIRSGYFNKIKEEKNVTFETIHKAKDGTLIPVEQSVRYFEMSGKSIFYLLPAT